ncbi:nucleoside 2-deoxyribosyltransferase domain-containing protein [bacterium]|nr:nucleoside 2-deoxyribosyltransferase domain-containing protein [bacterium]
MGFADNWQGKIVSEISNLDCVVFNPRRAEWDSTWVQSIDNLVFRKQVEWELRALEIADFIAMYFDPMTKAPVSLLEFGLFLRSRKLIVLCPEGFWRKGNVDIVCKRYRVKTVKNFEEFTREIKRKIVTVQRARIQDSE